jgi:hypothetical protein
MSESKHTPVELALSWAGVLASYLLWGLALSLMWRWYVVTLWPMQPTFGAFHGAGLALLTASLRGFRNPDKDESVGASVGRGIVLPIVVVALAWLFHAIGGAA